MILSIFITIVVSCPDTPYMYGVYPVQEKRCEDPCPFTTGYDEFMYFNHYGEEEAMAYKKSIFYKLINIFR